MSDPKDIFKPQGALLDCFECYPYFQDDFEVLVREGLIQVTGPESCKWLKSKTSLAEYFKWANGDAVSVPGGFWAPIEKAFGIKRHSLRRLAGNNANPLKPDISRAFKKIKPILQQLRAKQKSENTERQVYNYIKMLILLAKDEKQETIRIILEKIAAILIKNVDKNALKRRF